MTKITENFQNTYRNVGLLNYNISKVNFDKILNDYSSLLLYCYIINEMWNNA